MPVAVPGKAPVLLAVGLRRAGAAGWLPLLAWLVGIVGFLAAEFTVKAGEVAGIGLATVAPALIGHAVDRVGVPHRVAASARLDVRG